MAPSALRRARVFVEELSGAAMLVAKDDLAILFNAATRNSCEFSPSG
jgi:hypothetical protein